MIYYINSFNCKAMNRTCITLIVFLFLNIFSVNANLPKITEYTLENGLTVILCESDEIPSVLGAIAVRVGSKDDPADATGLAHYQEHMLFKGTTSLGTTDWKSEKPYIDSIFIMYDLLATKAVQQERDSIQRIINRLSIEAGKYAVPNELDKLIRGFGGSMINAGTAYDWTIFFNKFPPSQMQKWLELYAHRFKEPVFRLFQSELETVYEEKNLYEDIFFYPMLEEFQKKLYKVHPYGQQTQLGTTEHLKNPSLTRMKEFFDAWYVPGNMALILVGDFSAEEVKPLIASSFGEWEARTVPEHAVWNEKPIEGRELIEVKMSPIKMELLGFKTIPSSHPDKVVLDVCNYLISNEGQTGLIDKLVLDNQLIAAQMITMPYNDLLSTVLFVVPKLVGQSLDEAETLAMGELKKLASGKFSDQLLSIVKLEMIRNYELEIEDQMGLGMKILDAWYNREPLESVYSYPEKVEAVTRDDIIRFASEYFGDNYLAFHSSMGSPEKEKIDKPGYDPVQGNSEAESEFAAYLNTVPSLDPVSRFVDFDEDIAVSELPEGTSLYCVENPRNDIFTLKIKYGIGTATDPGLQQAASLMNYASFGDISLDSLKKAFALLGCTYEFDADKDYTTISITGLEKNLKASLDLINRVLADPVIGDSHFQKLIQDTKADRKIEDADAESVADALIDYVMYGDNSSYIHRLSVKDIQKTGIQGFTEIFGKARNYQAEVHYCGKKDAEELSLVLQDNFKWREGAMPSLAPVVMEMTDYPVTNVIIVNKSKATQSKIYFFSKGDPFKIQDRAAADAFNFYFGGGFTGLVLQEIRESRSLAYSAGARYRFPPVEDAPGWFIGYVGTQDDKTPEAVEVFLDLVRNMPEKEERMPVIRDFLVQNSYTARPLFRDISETVVSWEHMGYSMDPNKKLSKSYADLTFQQITGYGEKTIKHKPVTICIVGDKKRMDVESLSQFGEITYVKEKSLYTK